MSYMKPSATVPLGELVDLISGFAFKSERFASEGKLPIVRIRDVKRGYSETYYTGEYDELYVVNDGDLLVGMDGEFNRELWKGGKALLNQRVCKLISDERKLSSAYLYHFLPAALKQIEDRTPFATVKHLSAKEVRSISIPLPPLSDQRRIAAILDKADALRRKRKRALELLDTLTQSIFLDMFGEAAENPNNFTPVKLGDLCEFRGGSQPPKSTFTYEPGPGKVRLIQIRDYKTDAFATYIPEALAKRPASKTDVMIGRYGPPLFQILKGLEGSYNVALMKADPRSGVLRSFLFHLLRAPRLQADVISQSERSAGQTGVNLKFLNDYPAYNPPMQLQTQFDQLILQHETAIHASKQSFAVADTLFASLQHRAFSGQL